MSGAAIATKANGVYSDRYRTVDRSACSEVTVKKRMPDGTVVIRKSERC